MVDGETGQRLSRRARRARRLVRSARQRSRAGSAADLVIVQGGSNDDAADLAALPAASTPPSADLRQALPHAAIVYSDPDPTVAMTAVRRKVDRILVTEARRMYVRAISPLQEGSFTAADVDDIIDPGTHHPTVEGDRILGARLAADLRPRGAPPPGRGPRSAVPSTVRAAIGRAPARRA